MHKISSYTFSGIGPREQMQDAGIFRKTPSQNTAWCIVCDGIGGEPGGADAADICVREYDHFFSKKTARGLVKNTADLIKLGLLTVMDAFHNHIQKNPDKTYMGCTLSMVYFEDDYAYLSWCGDSRIYLFRNGKIIFKSLPHNTVFEDYHAGKITLKNAEASKTNIITRCISASYGFPVAESKRIKLKRGDRLLVCTDGVWNTLTKNDYREIAHSTDMEKAVGQLNAILASGAQDNFWGWIGEFN